MTFRHRRHRRQIVRHSYNRVHVRLTMVRLVYHIRRLNRLVRLNQFGVSNLRYHNIHNLLDLMYNSTFRMIQYHHRRLCRMLNYGDLLLIHRRHRSLYGLMCLSLQVLVNNSPVHRRHRQQCCYMLPFRSLHNNFLSRR